MSNGEIAAGLPSPPPAIQPSSSKGKAATYLVAQLGPDALLDTELMLLALAAGINDTTTFPNYRVFASNQTGNTALLAVGSFGLGGDVVNLRDIGFSLGLFILGGTLLGQLGHRVGRTKRAWLLCTTTLHTLFVLVAAALRHGVPTGIDDRSRFAVMSLLAFASGAQVAMARTVDVPEVRTTAMVTSAYIDFVTDRGLLTRDNRPRNRRAEFVLCLLLGSFIGAATYREVSPAFALLMAGLVKVGVCVSPLFNRAEMCEVSAGRIGL